MVQGFLVVLKAFQVLLKLIQKLTGLKAFNVFIIWVSVYPGKYRKPYFKLLHVDALFHRFFFGIIYYYEILFYFLSEFL